MTTVGYDYVASGEPVGVFGGMVWCYQVIRIERRHWHWWNRRRGCWKPGKPSDVSWKVLGKFRFRGSAIRLMRDLRLYTQSEEYVYLVFRFMLHRIEVADWLAGRKNKDPVKPLERRVREVVQCGDVTVHIVNFVEPTE